MSFQIIKKHIVPVLFLLTLTLIVYSKTMSHDFLINWDDNKYITMNEMVKGFTADHIKAAFTEFVMGNYAPAHMLSYMLDFEIWGLRPAGFIFANILLHSLNGLLFYILLIESYGRRLLAFLAAFIFLCHPVQVESVAWISERKNVLAMFFFLLSFYLFIRYRKKARQYTLLYVSSFIFFIMALLSKSVTVILPLVLFLYDLCFWKKEERPKWLADKLPFLIAAAAAAILAIKSHSVENYGGMVEYHGGSPVSTLITMIPVFVRYLSMLFWPENLTAVYDVPIRTQMDFAVFLSIIAALIFCVVCVFLYKTGKDRLFWLLLFIVGLFPVSQIVPLITLMNDRYLYFPLLGFAATVAIPTVHIQDRLSQPLKMLMLSIAALLLLLLPVLSFKQTGIWKNSITLWTDVTNKAPGLKEPWRALGESYHRTGMFDQALVAYQRAIAIDPLYPEVLNNIGCLYMQLGDFKTSQAYLQKLVNNYPEYREGRENLRKSYYYSKQQPLKE